jgi:hypothetical protein
MIIIRIHTESSSRYLENLLDGHLQSWAEKFDASNGVVLAVGSIK